MLMTFNREYAFDPILKLNKIFEFNDLDRKKFLIKSSHTLKY